MEQCYTTSWLDAKAENDAKGKTNREVQIEVNGPANKNKVDHTNALQSNIWRVQL
jgi:hypothetical protein